MATVKDFFYILQCVKTLIIVRSFFENVEL